MFTRIATVSTTFFLIASFVSAQSPVLPAAPEVQAAAPSSPAVFVVPAGTSVPLVLITPIRSRSSKPGDAVRARVAFPITVDNQVAIPPGSYVEGRMVAVAARAGGTGLATAQIRFDRLLFANGYATPLEATGSQALSPAAAGELAWLEPPGFTGKGFGLGGQSQPPPTLPPLPQIGPSKAAIIGGSAAGMGVIVVLSVILAHRHHHADYVLFDSGSQFRMVLEQPLTLDSAQVKAAISAAGAGSS